MGIQINFDEIKDSLDLSTKQKIFPNYNNNDRQFIKVTPQDDSCRRKYVINYDTNFASVATVTSALEDLVDLGNGVLDSVSSGGPAAPGTVLNGIRQVNQALQSRIKTTTHTEFQEIRFDVTLCQRGDEPAAGQRCYLVSLQVVGQWIITDADNDDQQESAAVTLFLNADGTSGAASFRHARGSNKPIDIPVRNDTPFQIQVGVVNPEGSFQVYGKVSETVTTDGRYQFIDSASIIRVDSIIVVIEEVPCALLSDLSGVSVPKTGLPNKKLGPVLQPQPAGGGSGN